MVVTLRWWLSACVCLACGRATLAATNYTVTDIGSLGGGGTYGFAINDAGHVTGYSDRPSGMGGTRAFLYDGAMHDLGSLGGRSTGTGINAAGQVVGFYESAPATNRAYRYDGTMHDLGTLGGARSNAYGINHAGLITGFSEIGAASTVHAFLYDGTMHDLGTLGGATSTGMAVNSSGQVTGGSDIADGSGFHAFLYDGTMHDLGTLSGGSNSVGRGINAYGLVAGYGDNADGENRAFLYDGTMHDLGTLGGTESFAFGINRPGHVVGRAQTAGNTTSHAFIYRDGQMFDLNSLIVGAPTVSLSEAEAINDAGQIVARGRYGAFGSERAFLLTPVPEPPSVVLAGLGLLGFMGACCRRTPGRSPRVLSCSAPRAD